MASRPSWLRVKQVAKHLSLSRPQRTVMAQATRHNPTGCNSLDPDSSLPDQRVTRRALHKAAMGGAALVSSSSLLAISSLLPGGSSVAAVEAPPTAPSAAAAELPLVPRAELAPGVEVSQVVKGCWQLSGGHRGDRDTDRTQGKDAVNDFSVFAAAGVTTLDTADIYGPSESLIGQYLRSEPQPPAQVLTKLCCFGAAQNSINREFVEQRIRGSMQRLGVKQLDMVQLYWNDYSVKNYVAAACHLADLQAEGLVKHVSLTNFDVERMAEIRNAGVTIASNQVQYSLLDRRPEVVMADYCRSEGISLLPYGVSAGGLFSEKYIGQPSSSVTVDTYSKSKYGSVIGKTGGWSWFQSLLDVLNAVASKHGVSVANVAARWTLDKPSVPAIIIGARNANHIPDHQRLFTFSLDAEDMAAIEETLERGTKPQGDCYAWERGGVW